MLTITLPTSLSKLILQGCRDLKTVARVSSITELAKLVITSCPQLKNITLPTTLMKLTVQRCEELQTVAAISDLAKLKKVNISQCPQLEELPNVAGLSCLEMITIDDCEKLENIAGIGECIGRNATFILQQCRNTELDFQVEVDAAESILNPQFFSEAIDGDAVIELDRVQSSDRYPEGSLSAIIICCLIVVDSSTPLDKINKSLRRVSENSLLSFEVCQGEWVITMVSTDQEEIYDYDDYWQFEKNFVEHGIMKKGCRVTVRKGQEWKTLDILCRIIDRLHEKGCSTDKFLPSLCVDWKSFVNFFKTLAKENNRRIFKNVRCVR